MLLLLVLHGVLGAGLFPTGRRLGRRSFLIAAIAPAATLLWLATKARTLLDGGTIEQRIEWVPELGLTAELRLDGFGALFVALVALAGVLVCVYSAGYYLATSSRLGRNAGLLVTFAGAMLVVVLADNLLLLYTGWELTSIASYLLIGNEHEKPHARAAALQALLVTSLGGLAMLAGFVLLGREVGSFSLHELVTAPPSGAVVDVALVLVLLGAFTKSAQYPFHFWLPGAMAAPTPISAYLHSATMVKAGVYLIARLAPSFSTADVWRPLVLTVGVVTMVAGGLRAIRQHDLKLLLAYGTVSQLGLLVVLFGAGTEGAATAGCLMLVAHALFKAALFMAVGTVDHHTGTRDLRTVPVLGARWRLFKVSTVIVAASMAGLPLAFGFVAKEAAFEGLLDTPDVGSRLTLAGVVAGSSLTVAYTARFVMGILGRSADGREPAGGIEPVHRDPRPAPTLVGPVVGFGVLTVALGIAPAIGQRVLDAATESIDPLFRASDLALWHGVNTALVLSLVAISAGAILFSARDRLDRVLDVGSVVPSGTRGYVAVLRGTNRVATRVTAIVQNGSLPIYAGVTLLTAALVPGVVLLTQGSWAGWPETVGAWAQLPVAVAVLGAAVAAAVVRRRFSAALFLGVAGYAMAGLFAVQGAPDLALTQVAIETLSTVLFVLVLRRLPDRFERTSTRQRRVGRVVVSGVVGMTVFLLAIVSRANRRVEPVSTEMIERSLPDGHGRNVVNVILVDIRGFDTMGEITVLAAAAIGAVALARVGRRQREARGA